jgi:uncharacterized membrane protein YphA (DoxX/SURF4 family)
MVSLTSIGRSFYGLAVIAYGCELFIYSHAITKLAPSWPEWIQWAPFPEYAAGTILVSGGAALVFGKNARNAGKLLGALFLIWFMFRSIPLVILDPSSPKNPEGNACESCAICAGALLVAASSSLEGVGTSFFFRRILWSLERLIPLGRYLLAAPMIYFGYVHIRFAQGVSNLVPAWMPWHLFWAYFCGAVLVSAGIAICFKIMLRWAASIAGVMIVLFAVLLNGPLAFAALRDVDLWTALFHTLAWSGGCFALAGSRMAPNWAILGESRDQQTSG